MYDLVILDSIIRRGNVFSAFSRSSGRTRACLFDLFVLFILCKMRVHLLFTEELHLKRRMNYTRQLIKSLDSVIEEGVTEKEIQNAKEQLKGGFLLGLKVQSRECHRNGKNELVIK